MKRFFRAEILVLATTIVACAVAIAAYRFRFSGEISTDHQVFADFGEYVGGVIGSFAALATVFLVWRTLLRMEEANAELRTQIEHAQNQAWLSEMRHRLDRVAADIESPGGPLQARLPSDLLPLLNELEFSNNATLGGLIQDRRFLMHARFVATELIGRTETHMLLQAASRQFQELAYCITAYDEQSGSRLYSNHFRLRYESAAGALCEIGMINRKIHATLSPPDGIGDLRETWGTGEPAPGSPSCSHGFHQATRVAQENWAAAQRKKRLDANRSPPTDGTAR